MVVVEQCDAKGFVLKAKNTKGRWLMKKLGYIVLGILLPVLGLTTPVFADENEIVQLKEQVDKLNKRISELEEKAARPTNVVPSGEAPSGTFVEGALSGERLVEDCPEGEDVAPRVGRTAPHLLGGHVAKSPQHDTGLCSRRGRRQACGLRALLLVRELG